MDGWIKLHRKSEDNELYFLEPFTKRQAWQDLILVSNHKDGKIIVRGIVIEIKRGQNGYSQETLAKRWKRSRGKVKRFLNYLKTIQQIGQQTVQQNDRLKTIITIINYEKYQGDDTTNDTTNGQQTDNKQYSNKNDKNIIYINNRNQIKNIIEEEYIQINAKPLKCLMIMIELGYKIEEKEKAIFDFIKWIKEKAEIYKYYLPNGNYDWDGVIQRFDRWRTYHQEKGTDIKIYKSSILQFLDPSNIKKGKQKK